jgi:hypothetical protein
MKDESFIELLKDTFLKENPEYHIDRQSDYEPMGIRLIQKYGGGMDPRQQAKYVNKSWVLNRDMYTDPSSGEMFKTRWDMSTDGEYLIYSLFNGIFYLIEAEQMDAQEIGWVKDPVMTDAELASRRLQLVDTLRTILVNRMMPFSKLFSGELESQHGVHLRMIQRGEHQHMRYKPQYGEVNWLRNGVLPWGSCVGWDITVDGRVACCRVDYDEYYNFFIEPLTGEQVAYYRKKYGIDDRSQLVDAIGRLNDAQAAQFLGLLRQALEDVEKGEKGAA